MTGEHVSARWAHWREQVDLAEYHARWAKLEAAGHSTHGEADLIERYVRQGGRPPSVLDAGCGMGRVAIELHHRGIEVEGADLDADLLAYAQADAPHVVWHLADLAEMALGRTYGVVAMPGNVMLFGHRTTGNAPFYYLHVLTNGDSFSLLGSDGHWYNYRVVDKRVTYPYYTTIANISANNGPMTAQLVACSKLSGLPTSTYYRIVITGRLYSIT